MEVPPPQEQVSIVRKLEASTEISVANGAYAISSDWYRNYKAAIGFGKDDPSGTVTKIDNSSIVENNRLKPRLIEGAHFFVLTKELWETLYKWFGGGPEVKLNVVLDDFSKPVAVTQFLPINLEYKGEKKEFIVNKYMKTSELLSSARELYHIPEEQEIRLLDFFNDHFNQIMENKSPLARYSLSTKQTVLVDYKNEFKRWENDIAQQISTNSYFETITASTPTTSSFQTGIQTRSSYYSKSSPGLCGFNNLGNTCFFNSGTQCLMHSMPFVKFFVDDSWKTWINRTNKLGTGGALATAFASIAHKMWDNSPDSVIQPSELKYAVGKFAPRFSGYEQHDSHELMMFMLDGIHEDLNRCKDKPYVESVTGNGTNDQEIADESWKRHKLRNDSIVVDNFHGLLRSELLCPKCKKTTVVFDPYLSLSLPLARENDRKLFVYFAPFDYSEKWIPITINISVFHLANSEIVSQEISKQIGRSVYCAPSTFSPVGKSLKWGFSDEKYYYSQFLIAFEIPDPNKFYIPCFLMGDVALQHNADYVTRDLIGMPFIIQCENDSTPEDKLKEIILEKIKCLNQTDKKIELTEEAEAFLKRIKPKEDEFKINFEKDIWTVVAGAKRSRIIPFVSASGIKIDLDTTKINLEIPIQNYSTSSPKTKQSKDKSGITLDACFKLFSAPDTLDEKNQWFCPHCRDFVCANKTLNVWNTPQILIIHFKRFSGNGWSVKKDDSFVEFPDELDMSQYSLFKAEGVSQKYRLYAVSEHMGSMGGGHYIAHARVSTKMDDGGKWYCFDDSSCSPASSEAAHSPLAYVLFYQRI